MRGKKIGTPLPHFWRSQTSKSAFLTWELIFPGLEDSFTRAMLCIARSLLSLDVLLSCRLSATRRYCV